jgi:hypothetical protein
MKKLSDQFITIIFFTGTILASTSNWNIFTIPLNDSIVYLTSTTENGINSYVSYVATSSGAVYRCINYQNPQPLYSSNSDTFETFLKKINVLFCEDSPRTLFAATDSGLYYYSIQSMPNSQWMPAPGVKKERIVSVTALYVNTLPIYAFSAENVYVSEDLNKPWTCYNLPQMVPDMRKKTNLCCMVMLNNQEIIIGSNYDKEKNSSYGLFKSTNSGKNWVTLTVDKDTCLKNLTSIAFRTDPFVFGTRSGLWYSSSLLPFTFNKVNTPALQKPIRFLSSMSWSHRICAALDSSLYLVTMSFTVEDTLAIRVVSLNNTISGFENVLEATYPRGVVTYIEFANIKSRPDLPFHALKSDLFPHIYNLKGQSILCDKSLKNAMFRNCGVFVLTSANNGICRRVVHTAAW